MASPAVFADCGKFVKQVTIRVLGGLLSAYHFSSEDPIYLERAIELADRILPVFDTPSGLPRTMINLGRRQGSDDPDAAGLVSTAEASTLQLEFRYLSYLTDNDEYWDRAEGVCCTFPNRHSMSTDIWQVMKMIKTARLPSGLVPIYMGSVQLSILSNFQLAKHSLRAQSGQFLISQIRLGSRGDSYYEYLL